MDILHAMKDALMKYETIDAKQIDDLMERKEVRPPADWDKNDDKSDKPTGGAGAEASANAEAQDKTEPKGSVGKPGDMPG